MEDWLYVYLDQKMDNNNNLDFSCYKQFYHFFNSYFAALSKLYIKMHLRTQRDLLDTYLKKVCDK